jgi:hypothetical protein
MPAIRNAFFAALVMALSASAAVDPALLNLVMPDAKVVSGIDVEASRSSAFGKYVLSQMHGDDERFRKFIADTGFDPRRDLAEIVAATVGDTKDRNFLIVGRGVFNPGRISAAARAAGARFDSYRDVELILHSETHVAGGLAFLDASTAVLGHVDSVKAAIDRYRQPGALLPPEVAARITQLSTENDAWFLTTGPLTDFFAGKLADPNLQGAMQGNLLQAVLHANGGIKFGADTIRISGEALTRSDKDAMALADVIRFIAGLVQLNKDSSPEAQKVASLLDTLNLTTDAATLRLTLSIPEVIVEKLFVPQKRAPRTARTKKTAALY